jgi:hypothetical protein
MTVVHFAHVMVNFDVMRTIVIALCSATLLLNCKSKSESSSKAEGSSAATTTAPQPAQPVPDIKLVPTWETVKLDYGSFKRPSGSGWQWTDNEAHNDVANITVTFQKLADGDFRDQLDELQKGIDDANLRDAPKFEKGERAKSVVAGQTALRSDGGFDNGTKFATRDYIIVTEKGTVVAMTRGPVGSKATVNGLADYIASTYSK